MRRSSPLSSAFLAAPLAFFAFFALGCATTPPAGPPPLVVASDLDNEPFAFRDRSGQPAGRDVEMMELVAEALGRELEWQQRPFDELLRAVESEEVDVLCATFGITDERALRVGFSRPYFTTTISAIVRTGPGEPRSLRDLAGVRIAAGRGTTAERALRRRLPGSSPIVENKEGLPAGERLLAREVDAVIMDGPAADVIVERGRGLFQKLTEPLAGERYALVVPLSAKNLRTQLDEALTALEQAGRLAELNAKYGLEQAVVF